jgi:DNA-binding CsgD family transcriptional regulator
VGDIAGIATSLESVAGVAVDAQRWQIAARLLAAAQALLDAAGYVRSRSDQARHDHELDQVRGALGEEAQEVAMAEGSGLSADEAVSYATRRRGNRDRPVSGWDSLTPAELEVAQMVGEGLTNPEVGRRLFISPRTVGHHLAHVYQKLGIHSRTA